MILVPRSVKIFVATAPANLHRSFEGLSNEVRCVLAADPLSGHVFLFLNRRRSQVKLLLWTRGGFTIVHKRLERVEIEVHELAMLLEGLDEKESRSSTRWDPPRALAGSAR
jgi:transposase